MTIKIDHWQPLDELLLCSHVQLRSLTDLENNLLEENISSVDLPLFEDTFNYIMKVEYSSRHLCPRCRLQTSDKENELCSRCFAHTQKF